MKLFLFTLNRRDGFCFSIKTQLNLLVPSRTNLSNVKMRRRASSSDMKGIKEVKSQLKGHELRPHQYFCGIEVVHGKKSVILPRRNIGRIYYLRHAYWEKNLLLIPWSLKSSWMLEDKRRYTSLVGKLV